MGTDRSLSLRAAVTYSALCHCGVDRNAAYSDGLAPLAKITGFSELEVAADIAFLIGAGYVGKVRGSNMEKGDYELIPKLLVKERTRELRQRNVSAEIRVMDTFKEFGLWDRPSYWSSLQRRCAKELSSIPEEELRVLVSAARAAYGQELAPQISRPSALLEKMEMLRSWISRAEWAGGAAEAYKRDMRALVLCGERLFGEMHDGSYVRFTGAPKGMPQFVPSAPPDSAVPVDDAIMKGLITEERVADMLNGRL